MARKRKEVSDVLTKHWLDFGKRSILACALRSLLKRLLRRDTGPWCFVGGTSFFGRRVPNEWVLLCKLACKKMVKRGWKKKNLKITECLVPYIMFAYVVSGTEGLWKGWVRVAWRPQSGVVHSSGVVGEEERRLSVLLPQQLQLIRCTEAHNRDDKRTAEAEYGKEKIIKGNASSGLRGNPEEENGSVVWLFA